MVQVMLHERVPSSSQTHSNSSSHGSEHAYAAVGGYRAVSCSGVETGMQGQGVAESRVAAEWHLPLLMSNWIGAGSRPKASVESGQVINLITFALLLKGVACLQYAAMNHKHHVGVCRNQQEQPHIVHAATPAQLAIPLGAVQKQTPSLQAS